MRPPRQNSAMNTPQTHDEAGTIERLSTRDGYDRWATIYDTEDNPLIALEEPEIDRLLGPVAGHSVVDVGCGTGRHAVRLARAGARVTAVDFSVEMLNKARAKPGAERIEFVQHDLHEPLPFADATFERVVCGLVLEHIEDLPRLFGEMRRICRVDGLLVLSAMHPAMMLRGITARFTDPESGRETRPHSFAHQISDFVMAALGAGLVIDHIGEHLVDEGLADRMERARKYLGWPLLLMLRLRPRPAGDASA